MHWQGRKNFCSRNWPPLKKPTRRYDSFSKSSTTRRWAVLCAWTWLTAGGYVILWAEMQFETFECFSPALLLSLCHKEWVGLCVFLLGFIPTYFIDKADFSAVRMLECLCDYIKRYRHYCVASSLFGIQLLVLVWNVTATVALADIWGLDVTLANGSQRIFRTLFL